MKLSLERMIIAAIGLAIAILVFIGAVSFWSTRELGETADWVTHTHKTIEALDNLEAALKNAQRVERGYVITGQERFLESYDKDINSIPRTLVTVKSLFYETPDQLKRFDKLQIQIDHLLTELKEVIDFRKNQGFEAAKEDVIGGDGIRYITTINSMIAEMKNREEGLLRQRDAAAKTTVKKNVYTIFVSGLFAFILTGVSSLIIHRQIVETRRNRQQLEQLNKELQGKTRELESIISIASHDLRSPLVNIKGFSGEIQKDSQTLASIIRTVAMPEDAQEKIAPLIDKYIPESLSFIQNSAAMMEQLLKGLLEVARAGLAELKPGKLDMDTTLAAVVKNLEFKIKAASVELTIDSLPQCKGDPTQITQIFSNLIDNAVKYRDPSRAVQIHVSGIAGNGQSVYCVEDNGRGIAESHREKIFELFCRLNPDDGNGEGVGLAIVKRMVERNGGKIWIESEEGKGSSFFVALSC